MGKVVTQSYLNVACYGLCRNDEVLLKLNSNAKLLFRNFVLLQIFFALIDVIL